MDKINLLSEDLLDNNTVDSVSNAAGVDKSIASSVLSAALPTLLSSVTGTSNKKKKQSNNSITSLLTGMLANNMNVEEEEEEEDKDLGSSILSSLLGNDKTDFLSSIASKLGLSTAQVTAVLVAAAPSILKKISSLMSTDISSETTSSTAKKKKTSSSTSTAKKKKTTSSSKQDNNIDLLSAALSAISGADDNSQTDILTSLASSLLNGNKK